jgi:hypothetical protein
LLVGLSNPFPRPPELKVSKPSRYLVTVGMGQGHLLQRRWGSSQPDLWLATPNQWNLEQHWWWYNQVFGEFFKVVHIHTYCKKYVWVTVKAHAGCCNVFFTLHSKFVYFSDFDVAYVLPNGIKGLFLFLRDVARFFWTFATSLCVLSDFFDNVFMLFRTLQMFLLLWFVAHCVDLVADFVESICSK